jgi:putative oxidoreductase
MPTILNHMSLNKNLNYLAWGLQGTAIALLIQSVTVKIVGSPETVFVFEQLGMGNMGQYSTALLEVLAVAGLLVQRFFREASVLAILLFTGGVFFHLTELGIEVYAYNGVRFYLNAIGLSCSIPLFFLRTHLAEVLYRKGNLD